AMNGNGRLTIETANLHLDETRAANHPGVALGDYVSIFVGDTGCGMSQAVAEKAFDPFFTTKGAGKGTGLGLFQVYGFITRSGGHWAIDTEPGEGTTVKLYLPRYAGPNETTDTYQGTAPPTTSRRLPLPASEMAESGS